MTSHHPHHRLNPESQASARAAGVEIRLLGGFDVAVQGVQVAPGSFRRRKDRSLVKLLALSPDHRLHQGRVIESLWPQLDVRSAQCQLHNTLSQVRRAFRASGPPGDDVRVALDEGILTLSSADGIRTDVQAFEERAELARAVPTLDTVRAALDLYRGDLLPHDAYDDWTQERRATLIELHLELLRALGELRLASGDAGGARQAFQGVLRREPCDELAHGGLIRVAGAMGDAGGVRRRFAGYATAMSDALQAEPSPPMVRLFRSVLDDLSEPDRAPWPRRPRPLVGRNAELGWIGTRFDDPHCRLITLRGLAGVGKTRLAVEAATLRAAPFTHGSVFVDLARLSGKEALVHAITRSLGLPTVEAQPQQRLVRFLGDKRLLLLLDAAEGLGPEASLLSELLARAPGVQLLVTSRRRLGLRDEWVLEVDGLEAPQAPYEKADPDRFSAARLFLDAAHRVRPGFEPTEADLVAVGTVCYLVGGVPLALENASAWTRTLSCRRIARELERDLDLGDVPFHDVPERHRSLRRAFEDSWSLLDDVERDALTRLGVFRGPFSVDAARRSCDVRLGHLARLADKSLLARRADDRFVVPPVVRPFVVERLGARTDAARWNRARAAEELADPSA